MRQARFHGRHEGQTQVCGHPTCTEPGEFRAPAPSGHSFDGPGEWRWFCLEHVREFNAGYNWFEGMNAEEILAAQGPVAGWRTESPSFRPTAGVDGMPRWGDFEDPLDAISARAAGIKSRAQREVENDIAANVDGRFTPEEARALDVMGLSLDTDRAELRRRYSQLVRSYHPDRNGGDRQHEARLAKVVEAYQLLKKSRSLKRA